MTLEVSLLDDAPISRFNDICEYKDYLKAKQEREEVLKITLVNGNEYELELSEPETSILE